MGKCILTSFSGANAEPGTVPARKSFCKCSRNARRVVQGKAAKEFNDGYMRPQPQRTQHIGVKLVSFYLCKNGFEIMAEGFCIDRLAFVNVLAKQYSMFTDGNGTTRGDGILRGRDDTVRQVLDCVWCFVKNRRGHCDALSVSYQLLIWKRKCV